MNISILQRTDCIYIFILRELSQHTVCARILVSFSVNKKPSLNFLQSKSNVKHSLWIVNIIIQFH